jgi:hypothetical protein
MSDNFAERKLGEHDEGIAVSSSEENRQIALALATQANRTLEIVSRDLDPRVYANGDFVEAVKNIALKSRHSRIRIVVLDANAVVTRGHRLLELAARLSTFIEIRVPGQSHRDFNQAIYIADGAGVIHRLLSDRYDGVANFNDRSLAGELLRKFDNMWEHASGDPSMRRLRL